jgi:phosphoribosyl-ATP pyrophosphohydrolase/phosphoribosyl-AMP cyclohydrolase
MPDFKKLNGLIPAIIQDVRTNQVLMLGFMNEEAFSKTKESGLVTFYSRSRRKLWTKGEESGNYLHVVEIFEDCDQDSLLVRAKPDGPVCHTGSISCFDASDMESLDFLVYLQEYVKKRQEQLPEGSYTTSLFKAGINQIAKKLGEEAVELVIASKDQDNDRFLNEAADLIYHLIVLLLAKGKSLQDVEKVLMKRH